MNKEPIGLYIFRFVTGFALLVFMCMLYWSSALLEVDLRDLRSDISQLKNELFTLRIEMEKSQNEMLLTLLNNRESTSQGTIPLNASETSSSVPVKKENKGSQIAANQSANLLQTDPFYTDVLPKLLGKGFVSHGVQHMATIGKPANLHPFSLWSQVIDWQNLCSISAAQLAFGKYETFVSDMAERMEERLNPKTGLPEYWVFLRKDVYWHPLQPSFFSSGTFLAPQFLRKNQVTAEDFKFFYDAMMNPYVQEPRAVSLRTYYSPIEEFSVVDKFTFVVRWKAQDVAGPDGKTVPKIKYIAKQLTGSLVPLAGFVYKYFPDGKKIVEEDSDPETYRTNSVWAQNFANHWAKNIIVGCGAWIFDGMNDRQIKFKRNASYYSPLAALTEAIEVDFKDSPDNIWQAFKSNQLDSYTLQPDQQLELKEFLKSDAYQQQAAKGQGIKRLDYIGRSYNYVAWNQAKPFFKSTKVRNALTMAIDRKRIIDQNLNGMGIEITGTFYRYSSAYDPSIKPLPYDPQQARRLLEEEGWYDSDGDGVIDKLIDGKRVPFSFGLTYYVKNSTTKSVCEYIATTLKEIGIDCRLNGVDLADLSATMDDKSFDAYYLGWALGTPPEDPRQIWDSSGAKEKGSSNTIGFANAEIDEIINKLDYEDDPKKRVELYYRFDAIIHAEQPYTFLFTPKVAFLYREYLQNVFLPVDRQDLVPGADIAEPNSNIFWLKTPTSEKK